MCSLVVALVWAMQLAAPDVLPDRRDPDDAVRDLSILTDPPVELLHPKTERTPQEIDRLHAVALAATGRMLELRGQAFEGKQQPEAAQRQYGRALRKYQRAFRLDRRPTALLYDIVGLARTTGRIDEAVRYAVLAAQRAPFDATLIRWLSLYLAEQGDRRRALALYEGLLDRTGADDGRPPDDDQMPLWLEMGRLAFLLEDYGKASTAFSVVQSAVASHQEPSTKRSVRGDIQANGETLYALFGRSHLAAERYEMAEAAFRRAADAGMPRGLLEYHLARVAVGKGEGAAALKHLEAALESDLASQGTAPYELLITLLRTTGRSESVPERLVGLARNRPDNIPLGLVLARVHAAGDRPAEAEAIYRRCLNAFREGRTGSPSVEALRGLAAIYRHRRDAASLRDVLTDVVRHAESLDPLADETRLLAKDRHLTGRVLDSERLPSELDDRAYERLAMAQLALKVGRLDEADRLLDRAARARPDRAAVWQFRWGLDLLDAGHFDRAARAFLDATGRHNASDPSNAFQAGLHFFRAEAMALSGRTEGALAAARTARRLRGDSARIAGCEAWIHAHTGNRKEARTCHAALVARFDDRHDPETRNVLRNARFELSRLNLLDGNLPQAEEWLEQVLDEFPEDASAQNDLAFLWVDQGKHLARSLRMIRSALEAQPHNRAFQDSLGWAYFQLGRDDDAIRELEKAASREPPDGTILGHLGIAYQRLGRRDDAREAWRRAAEAFEVEQQTSDAEAMRKRIADTRDNTSAEDGE